MNILLIQPRQGTSFGISKIVTTEPLGLESIASQMLHGGHDVRIVDLKVEKPSRVDEELRKFSPHAVGISCSFTTDVYPTLEIAAHVKERAKNAYVFVGGHHASLIPDDLLTANVDAVVIGEGEVTAAELVNRLSFGLDPSTTHGVLTHENHAAGSFEPRSLLKDINHFHPPARHLTSRLRARYHMAFDAPLATMEGSRGCPFDCNFCSVWVFFNRKARVKSPEKALIEIEGIQEKEIFFTDDIAFINRNESEKLALLLKDNGVRKAFTAETRADIIMKNKDLMKLWSEVGLKTVFVGIEKVDDEGLKSVNKRTKASTNDDALDFLKSIGIRPIATFIVDPMFGDEDFDKLEEYARVNELIAPTYTILTPLPGTEVYNLRKHELLTDNYYMYDLLHSVLPTNLPIERFYERFSRLYGLGHLNTQMGFRFFLRVFKNMRRMDISIAFKIFKLMSMMRNPSKYMELHQSLNVFPEEGTPYVDVPKAANM